MKNFQNYTPEKYASSDFQEVENGIYYTKSPYADKMIYVTSLSFEMEPECYGEEESSPQNITQLPFEDLLDKFYVYVTDFYDALNKESETLCYQEFGSSKLSDIEELRTIIGKRFYAVPLNQSEMEEDDDFDDDDFDDDDFDYEDTEYKIVIE